MFIASARASRKRNTPPKTTFIRCRAWVGRSQRTMAHTPLPPLAAPNLNDHKNHNPQSQSQERKSISYKCSESDRIQRDLTTLAAWRYRPNEKTCCTAQTPVLFTFSSGPRRAKAHWFSQTGYAFSIHLLSYHLFSLHGIPLSKSRRSHVLRLPHRSIPLIVEC
jgi:hypothetical protein